MEKYYLHSGTAQAGPFSIEDLKVKQITADTMVWYDGLTEWKKAGEIPELQTILQVTPPPFTSKAPPPLNVVGNIPMAKTNALWKIVRNAALLILFLVGVLFVISMFTRNGGNFMPNKTEVRLPIPRVVESHANEDPSSTIFHFHEGVYATVLNQGGDGKVLIKATLKQGANTYVKTDFAFIGENQTKEFHFDFTEPSRYDAQMSYGVIATAMQ